jgi:hypothetical protein
MEMGHGGPPPAPPHQGQSTAYAQPQYAQGGGVPDGNQAANFAQNVQRAVRTPETKPFFLTSEFVVWLATVIAVLVAAAVTKKGSSGADVLTAGTAWTLVTVIGFAYVISRGISKAGAKYRDRLGSGN